MQLYVTILFYLVIMSISLIVDCLWNKIFSFFLLRVAVQQRGYKTIYIRFTLGIGSDMPKRWSSGFLTRQREKNVTGYRQLRERGEGEGRNRNSTLLKTILENDWRCYRCRLVGLRSRQPTKFLVRKKVVVSYTFDPSDRPLACNTTPPCHSCIHTRACAVCLGSVLTSW